MKGRVEDTQDYTRGLPEKDLSSRRTTFLVIIAGVFLLLSAQLFNLQIVQGERYRVLSEENYMRITPTPAPRGNIYASGGEVLVTSRPAFSVFYWYMDSQKAQETLPRLAEILGIHLSDIEKKVEQYAGRYYEPIPIARDISPEKYTAIAEDAPSLPGVFIEAEPIRSYPYSQLASPVLGYVGEISSSQLADPRYAGYKVGQIVGHQGIEAHYEEALRGEDGGLQVEVDYRGRPTGNVGPGIDPVPGDNLELYLDLKLQQAAEAALYDTLKSSTSAKGGSVVVLDVKTGGVLVMASTPSFDPNRLVTGISQQELSDLLERGEWRFANFAITGLYPPGSTFKLVSAIAALSEGVTTVDERVFDPGYHPLAPTLICNKATGHGAVNMVEAIGQSCNVYFYEMGRRMGVDTMASYAKALGLGQKTGVDLPGENYGTVPSTEWKKKAYNEKRVAQPEFLLSEHMMAAMGQVFHLDTPIQMASVVQAIANHGVRMKPSLVKRIVSRDGVTVQEMVPEVASKLQVEDWVLDTVRQGMSFVANDPRGTAYWTMHDLPAPVAGKTGTAENPLGKSHAWFVGFAPFDNPQIAISVVVEQGGSGSAVAAPVARAVFDAYFAGLVEEGQVVETE